MNLTGNTILITGGGSGIGRGLAESFVDLGNKVIICGRRKAALEQAVASRPALVPLQLDVDDPAVIRDFAARVLKEHPDLNVLVNNAGISRPSKLTELPAGLEDAEATITTNLLGPIRMIAAFLPHLLKKGRAAIINVGSGLAFVPLPAGATYSATKAALHSYTLSLRAQLADTSVEVIEIIPPAVVTDLTPGRSDSDTRMMPLKDYIAETMKNLAAQPTPQEVLVERVKFLRFAESSGNFEKAFAQMCAFRL
jgi:uncharacterized oxidoreductase